jgi:hypothetical protein
MSNELGYATTVIYSTGALYQPDIPRKVNLGGAILLAAIKDYRGAEEKDHEDAQQFLYPETADWLERYEWVVAVAVGVNAAWLRDALDRSKAGWDMQRELRKQNQRRKAS